MRTEKTTLEINSLNYWCNSRPPHKYTQIFLLTQIHTNHNNNNNNNNNNSNNNNNNNNDNNNNIPPHKYTQIQKKKMEKNGKKKR